MSKAVKILSFILSMACLAVIVYFSLFKEAVLTGTDKNGHFLAYFAQGFLFFLCFSNLSLKGFFLKNLLPFFCAVFLSFIFGYAIELIQPSFGRVFEAMDLAADALGSFGGALLGFICVLIVRKIEISKAED